MPRYTPIPEVFEMEADQPIIAIRGTLTKLYKPREGTNSNGPWLLQGGVLEDSQGNRVDLQIKDKGISMNWQGREVLIHAHKGDKGWSGVYAADDTYNGQTKRKLKITKTAEVSLCDDSGGQEQGRSRTTGHHHGDQGRTYGDHGGENRRQDPPPRQREEEPTRGRQQAAPPSKAEEVAANLRTVKHLATQLANIQILCATTVDMCVIPQIQERTGKVASEDLRQSLIMNMCIQLQQTGAHFKMPTYLYEKTAPQGQTAGNQGQGQSKPAEPMPEPERPQGLPAKYVWDAPAKAWRDPDTGDFFF